MSVLWDDMGCYGCFMGILRIWGFIGMLWVFLMVLIYLIKITQQMQIETPTLFIDNKVTKSYIDSLLHINIEKIEKKRKDTKGKKIKK